MATQGTCEVMEWIDPNPVIPPTDKIRTETCHKLYPTMRFRPHRWQEMDDFWRSCIIRGPVKRLMSGFLDRVVERGELKNPRKLARGDVPHLTVTPDHNHNAARESHGRKAYIG